jgi:hypothetical protein
MSTASSSAGLTASANVTKVTEAKPTEAKPTEAKPTEAKINKHIFTVLVADDEQKKMGFNFVVVHNETREMKAGFAESKDASDFSDMLNTR